MSKEANQPTTQLAPESQRQRWMKYGSNVVLSVVIVVLLCGFAIYISGREHKRIDFTATRVYSLKPQTQNIIDHLDQPIEIYSLYSKQDNSQEFDYASRMADLLDEYHRSSKNIQVHEIDPEKEPGKLQDLIDRVKSRYSGEVQQYDKTLKDFSAARGELSKFAQNETTVLDKVVETASQANLTDEQLVGALQASYRLVHGLEGSLSATQDSIDTRLKGQLPDYKLAATDAESAMENIAAVFKQVVTEFTRFKDQTQVPEPIRKYMADSLPRYIEGQKLTDETLKNLKQRGDIKVDALLQGVRRQAVLVIGKDNVKVIPFGRIWQGNADRFVAGEGQDHKLRFAGEQEITAAIVQLQMTTKPKVVFVRAGGPPVADVQFSENAPFSIFADRLRQYGYEVSEKDLTGMWNQMAQYRGMPPSPEASDKDLKEAVWIGIDQPTQSNGFVPGGTIADKLAEHLMNGGSAMVLVGAHGDSLSVALKEWGIDIHPDNVILHERVEAKVQGGNWMDQIGMFQPFFEASEYGNAEFTRPVNSLQGLVMLPIPVNVTPARGYHATAILPIPHDNPAWIAHDPDLNTMLQREVKYDGSKGDEPIDKLHPAFAGAAVESDKGGRLVVFGSLDLANNGVLGLIDFDLAVSTKRQVIKYPANAELLSNAVYWLSRNDNMIAISPAAMEVPLIKEMGPATLGFVHVGILIIGLPLLVIASGITMYVARRD